MTLMNRIFVFGLILLLCSCESDVLYQANKRIDGGVWKVNDVAHFEFETADTSKLHNFYISLRNREDYPFSNIYFFVEMEFPNGKKSIDTVECQLADEQGKWLGNSSANLYDNRFLYQQGKQFPLAGRYKIDIRHGMRTPELQGITDVGFRLSYTRR
jgi:gliding motility-associated lipoprotein GldH